MSDFHFYPNRGPDAWPSGCPSCGSEAKAYQESDDEHLDEWVFGCGCALQYDEENGSLEDVPGCPFSMQMHLENVVTHEVEVDA